VGQELHLSPCWSDSSWICLWCGAGDQTASLALHLLQAVHATTTQRKRLKQLHWDKIRAVPSDSLWAKVSLTIPEACGAQPNQLCMLRLLPHMCPGPIHSPSKLRLAASRPTPPLVCRTPSQSSRHHPYWQLTVLLSSARKQTHAAKQLYEGLHE
jgi:hypothetical protein